MQGIFYGLYPASGVELLELSYDASTSTLTGTKLTGNQFVRAGRLSWEATPSGCRVVSSMWSGVYKPRWDPCSLTMWEDHLTIDLGGNDDDHLTFVRAEAALLLGWDERRSPMNGFADVFERCDVSIEAGWDAVASGLWELLHRSEHTVVLDQFLVVFPLMLIGGYQLSADSHQPLLVLLAAAYTLLVCSRLRYLGWLA